MRARPAQARGERRSGKLGGKAIEISPRYPISRIMLMVAECRRGNRVEAEAQLHQLEANIPDFGPKTLQGCSSSCRMSFVMPHLKLSDRRVF